MRLIAEREPQVNIGILAGDDKILWTYRDMLNDLSQNSRYKINLTLTKRPETIIRGLTFVMGGLDFVLVVDRYNEARHGHFVGRIRENRKSTKVLFTKGSKQTDILALLNGEILLLVQQ